MDEQVEKFIFERPKFHKSPKVVKYKNYKHLDVTWVKNICFERLPQIKTLKKEENLDASTEKSRSMEKIFESKSPK